MSSSGKEDHTGNLAINHTHKCRGRTRKKVVPEKRRRKLRVMSEPPTWRDKTIRQTKAGHHFKTMIGKLQADKKRLEERMSQMKVTKLFEPIEERPMVIAVAVDAPQVPLQSWSDIISGGLSVVLRSKVPLAYFLHSCILDMSAENLLFYLEVSRFETTKYAGANEQLQAASRIRNQFVSSHTFFELNIEAKLKKALDERLKSSNLININSCFAEIKNTVVKNMEDSWRRFKQTPNYQLLQELGERGNFESEHSKVVVVERLLNFLKTERSRDRIRFKMLSPYVLRFIEDVLLVKIEKETLAAQDLSFSTQQQSHHEKNAAKNGQSAARFFTPL